MKWCADLHNNQLSPIHYNFINLQFWSVAMKKVEIVMILFIVGFIYSSAYGWDHVGFSSDSPRNNNYFEIHFVPPEHESCRNVLFDLDVPGAKTYVLNVQNDVSAKEGPLAHFMPSKQWIMDANQVNEKLGNARFNVIEPVKIAIVQKVDDLDIPIFITNAIISDIIDKGNEYVITLQPPAPMTPLYINEEMSAVFSDKDVSYFQYTANKGQIDGTFIIISIPFDGRSH